MRSVVLLLLLLALTAVVVGCYTPPPYVPPASLPSPTPANATAVAALQNGPTATQVAVAQATSIAASSVTITDVSLDPSNSANSAVKVLNHGQTVVDLSGWTLLVANYRVDLPTTDYMSVGPGSTMVVHLGSSPAPTTGQDVYVGMSSLQSTPRGDPDRTVLLNPEGQVASTYPPQ